jgi:DNA ligase 1
MEISMYYHGDHMKYIELVLLFEKLESTSKKLVKRDMLAEFFKKSEDLDKVVLMSTGIVSSTEELGLAQGLIQRIIIKSYGISDKDLTKKFKETGDLGKTAEFFALNKRQKTLMPKELTVEKVFNNISGLSGITGEKSQDRKQQLIIELLSQAKPLEARYIIRTVLGDMRTGVAAGIVRDAIARAFEKDPKEIEKINDIVGDFGKVAVMAKDGNLQAELSVGKPVRVMLADRAKDLQEAMSKFENPAIEVKYDGFRIQAHKSDKMVQIFSRRMENVTSQFPDIVSMVRDLVSAKDCIIEGEAIAIKDGVPQPFQMLSRRIQRKYEIEKMVKEIPVQVNLFDLIYLGKKSYMNEPLKKRWTELSKIVKETKFFCLADHLETNDFKKAQKFYKASLAAGQEGAIIKNLDAIYQPGKRTGFWLKVKEILEPLDLVVTGAEWGEGKRANWLGSLILSARDGNEFKETGRMASGLTEEQMESLTKILKKLVISEEGKIVKLKPEVVVEVGYEEIQKSPKYPSGYALRFPRLLRIRIDEKNAKDANTVKDIEKFFRMQRKEK